MANLGPWLACQSHKSNCSLRILGLYSEKPKNPAYGNQGQGTTTSLLLTLAVNPICKFPTIRKDQEGHLPDSSNGLIFFQHQNQV